MYTILLALACTGSEGKDTAGADTAADTDVPAADGEGTLSFRFAIDEDYAAAMTEAPAGPFYGGIFYEADVTELGTTEGAEPLESFLVELTLEMDGSFTDVLHTTGLLPAERVYVLGYLDTDDNGPHTGPDQGDPVTRPGTAHRVDVVADTVTAADVLLDFLAP